MKKTFYILAGPNGAGKTTFALTSLKKELQVVQFINADEIARGIAPLNPEAAALKSGKLMLSLVDEAIATEKSLCVETTLSGKNYLKIIRNAKQKGYKIVLIFLWLESAKMALKRVKRRVKSGGHNIPENVVKRRYNTGLSNLFEYYLSACDEIFIFDNNLPNTNKTKLIAKKTLKNEIVIYNNLIWEKISSYEKKK